MEEHSKRKNIKINEGMHLSENTREGIQRERERDRMEGAGGGEDRGMTW